MYCVCVCGEMLVMGFMCMPIIYLISIYLYTVGRQYKHCDSNIWYPRSFVPEVSLQEHEALTLIIF